MDLAPIQRLVEQAYEECLGATPLDDCPKGTPSQMATCKDCLREAYYDDGRTAVNYNCERRRWMYIIRNLPPAAWDTYQLLRLCQGGWEVVLDAAVAGDDRELRVVSAGCGPGSDLIGTLGWINEDGKQTLAKAGVRQVSLVGLDGEMLWEPFFRRSLWEGAQINGGLEVVSEFRGLGETFEEIAAARPHVLQFSWLWSEFDNSLEAGRLWNQVSAALPRPCMVVFIDRTEERVAHMLDMLTVVTPGDSRRVDGACGERSIRLPLRFSEQVEALLPKKNIKSVSRVLILR